MWCDAGEAAEALLREVAGSDGAATLEQLCAGSPAFEAGGDAVTLLGRQQQFVAGSQVSSFLLLRTRPASLLTANQVGNVFCALAWRSWRLPGSGGFCIAAACVAHLRRRCYLHRMDSMGLLHLPSCPPRRRSP